LLVSIKFPLTIINNWQSLRQGKLDALLPTCSMFQPYHISINAHHHLKKKLSMQTRIVKSPNKTTKV